jgi:enterochelin esterase-like enzyme
MSHRRSPFANHTSVDHIAAFDSLFLGNARPIDVLLPPGYHLHPEQTYNVLYLNDGQDIEALRLRQTLDRLYAHGELEQLIVVGIHATANRLREYGTAGRPNAQCLGALARKYSRFVTDEVMPAMQQRYRIRRGPACTAIAGFSLGGLMAFDLGWRRPDCFGTVGAFSGSFWWRTDDSSAAAKQSSRIMHRRVREWPTCPAIRAWFQAGTEDETSDRDGDGVIDAIQDTTELVDALVARGLVVGRDLLYVEVPGGQHHQSTWSKIMPSFLTWAFPLTPHASTMH